MKYTKPPLTFEEQAALLIERGLVAPDRNLLIARLKAVNYYRLSGYLFPFRNADDTFKPDTKFETVWLRYAFDRRLRILVMDAVERIEIAVRTQLAYHHAHIHGPFGYVSSDSLPKLTANQRAEWLQKLREEVRRSKEIFVDHFQNKYGESHSDLPIWMMTEIMAFGHMLTMFRGVDTGIKQKIAAEFGIPDTVLFSWLGALNVIRNICAHHGRLWNRVLGYKPLLPYERKHPIWHKPVAIHNDRIFVILTICKYLLGIIAPQSGWTDRFKKFLGEYPDIPRYPMGFPENWEESSLWK